jgi:hypothetical protein
MTRKRNPVSEDIKQAAFYAEEAARTLRLLAEGGYPKSSVDRAVWRLADALLLAARAARLLGMTDVQGVDKPTGRGARLEGLRH